MTTLLSQPCCFLLFSRASLPRAIISDKTNDMIKNLPVRSLVHKGLTIEGYSRAAVQSYWRIPELKLMFDLGGSPWSFMGTQTVFVTHAHLDHLAAIPVFVARRRMMKMEPPTIYLPEETVENVRRVLMAWQRLDRGRMLCNLIGMKSGDEIELSREHVVTAFATKHTVPSIGYVVWDRRRKLKASLQGLSGDQIRDRRLAGEDCTGRGQGAHRLLCGRLGPSGIGQLPPRVRIAGFDHRNDILSARTSQRKDSQIRAYAFG